MVIEAGAAASVRSSVLLVAANHGRSQGRRRVLVDELANTKAVEQEGDCRELPVAGRGRKKRGGLQHDTLGGIMFIAERENNRVIDYQRNAQLKFVGGVPQSSGDVAILIIDNNVIPFEVYCAWSRDPTSGYHVLNWEIAHLGLGVPKYLPNHPAYAGYIFSSEEERRRVISLIYEALVARGNAFSHEFKGVPIVPGKLIVRDKRGA